jgi:hypothetical protein
VAGKVDLGYITNDEQEKTNGHFKTPAQEKEAGAKKEGSGTIPELSHEASLSAHRAAGNRQN